MSAIQRYNRSGPFWDFVADQDKQQNQAPFGGRRGANRQNIVGGNDNGRHIRASSMPIRGRHGHHTPLANQDQEMRDPASETEDETLVGAHRALRFSDSEVENFYSGDEGRRGPGKHGRGGRMGMGRGGRGMGMGMGMRGKGMGMGMGMGGKGRGAHAHGHGRGGMGMGMRGGMGGGPRARGAGNGPLAARHSMHFGGEMMPFGGEGHQGRGGRMGGRGRGFGGPQGRHSMHFDETMYSGDESRHGHHMRCCGKMGKHGPGFGGPKARGADAGPVEAREGMASDTETPASGDETPQDKAARQAERRGARMAARGMGKGHHGPGAHGFGKGNGSDNEGAGFGGRGFHGRHGPHGGMRGFGHGRMGKMHGHGAGEGKWKPEADVFDHAEAFIVHVSVPGAKKDDVEVNWNSERSALVISGTITRPADEEVLKTIAMNERHIGAFKRRVHLGNKFNPVAVDVEAITAKIEDGVLRIEVPKTESEFVEIRKVDIV